MLLVLPRPDVELFRVLEVSSERKEKLDVETGLRLDEARRLQVGDIDAERGLVHIHRGKGANDRYVPLPSSTLHWLRKHWVTHRNPKLLFPAKGRNHKQSRTSKTPIQTSTVQQTTPWPTRPVIHSWPLLNGSNGHSHTQQYSSLWPLPIG